VAGIRIAFVALARGQAVWLRLRVEFELSVSILEIIFAATILIESAYVRNIADVRLVEYIVPAVKEHGTFCGRV
jgi:hypothetical protein